MAEPSATELLERAAAGDAAAWGAIVERYERLVWWVVRGFRYDDATAADVVQTVWLRLAEHCTRIRDPEQLASWLATTCRHECLSVGRRRHREVPEVAELEGRREAEGPSAAGIDERLLEDETQAEVVRAFAHLPSDCQRLLRLLCADPPLDYRTISDLTGRPVGSIGPTRARCLGKLRRLLEDDHV